MRRNGRQRLESFVEEWWILYAEPNLERSTLAVCRWAWAYHARLRLGSLRLRDVTALTVVRFRASLEASGVGVETIRKTLTMLQSVFQRAVECQLLEADPVRAAPKPPVGRARAVPAIGPAIVEAIRADLRARGREHDARLMVLLAYAGLRPHGLSSSLYVGDEVWSWPAAGELLEAMQTGLIKRPDSKLLAISTAAAQLDSPLGRMRARALAHPSAKRTGPLVTANGDLAWLEWSLPDDAELSDLRAVKRCNPVPWITIADLRRQRAAVPEGAFAQFHACRWGQSEGSWLPAGAWQTCIGEPEFTDGEDIWIGVDVGGERSATAVVWVNAELHVGCSIFHGDPGVLAALDQVRALAAEFNVREVIYDPWRFGQAAQELEREGLLAVAFPQNDSRMIPASARLHAAIVERRITLPADEELARHAADAIAKHSRRGWRIDKPGPRVQIDAMIALCIAVERAEHRPEPVALLGWL